MSNAPVSKPTVIDLFSGCGGVSLGFAQAGFDVRVAVEIDATAVETYKANMDLLGDVTVLQQDIRSLRPADILKAAGLKRGDCTVVTGCAPCQGFSKHRKSGELSQNDRENNVTLATKAKQDIRNKLFVRLIGFIIGIAPDYYVIENVPELKEGVGRPLYDKACRMLTEAGYSVSGDVIQCYQYGIPQNRRRLVMLGCKTDLNRPALTLPPITHENPKKIKDALDKVERCMRTNKGLDRLHPTTRQLAALQPWRTVRQEIADYPDIEAGQTHKTVPQHITAILGKVNIERLMATAADGGSRKNWPEHLKLACHKTHAGHADVYGRMRWDTPSPTITGGFSNISKGRFAHPVQHRGISLREGAALQTFPDTFQFKGALGQVGLQIGNAVPVLLAQTLAEHICRHLSDSTASSLADIEQQEGRP